MKPMHILRLLALAVLSVSCASCVSDDWYDDDDDYYDDDYYGRRRRYDDYDYDYAYERGRRDGERYERERRERDRERYDRDRRERRDRDDASVRTPKGFVLAGSFKAGDAVECGIPTSHQIKKVRIVCTAGTVSVNTVVLREGGSKTSFPVTRRLAPGETAEIDLGGHRKATGLRVSAGGKGAYNVYVH
ncbi:MAG: hypothetical protein II839_10645 [Kiritimatiellae bacterium]|nr:hypothetical protein [Kiritimatiellia bacterium]